MSEDDSPHGKTLRGSSSSSSSARSHAKPALKKGISRTKTKADLDTWLDDKIANHSKRSFTFWHGLLTFLPIAVAGKIIGFKWATGYETPKFSIFLLMSIASLILSFILLLALGARRLPPQLCTRGHLKFMLVGIGRGIQFSLENAALAILDPTLFSVLRKGTIVSVIVIASICAKSLVVDTHQVLTVVITVFAITQYTTQGLDGGESSAVIGIVMMVVASICEASTTTLLNYLGKTQIQRARDIPAERLRCFLSLELAKAVTFLGPFFMSESAFITEGLFSGWDHAVVIGGVAPTIVTTLVGQLMNTQFGGPVTQLVSVLDVPLVYLCNICVLQRTSLDLNQLITIAVILCSVCSFFLFERRMNTEKIKLLRQFSSELQETTLDMADKISHSRMSSRISGRMSSIRNTGRMSTRNLGSNRKSHWRSTSTNLSRSSEAQILRESLPDSSWQLKTVAVLPYASEGETSPQGQTPVEPFSSHAGFGVHDSAQGPVSSWRNGTVTDSHKTFHDGVSDSGKRLHDGVPNVIDPTQPGAVSDLQVTQME